MHVLYDPVPTASDHRTITAPATVGPESIMDFNNIKGFGFVGCDIRGSYGSNNGSLGLEKLYCLIGFYSTRKD